MYEKLGKMWEQTVLNGKFFHLPHSPTLKMWEWGKHMGITNVGMWDFFEKMWGVCEKCVIEQSIIW